MSTLTFNTKSVRRIPIKRNNLFYDKECFAFDIEIGKNYIEQDMSQTIILYQVDASQTQTDAVYGETDSDSVIFKTPIEVPCIYEVGEPELKSYDKTKNLGTYMKTGKLKAYFYMATLNEMNIEIKKGDYIGVVVNETHIEYFVVNAINNGYDNQHTMFGTRNFWVTVDAYPVDASEFTA